MATDTELLKVMNRVEKALNEAARPTSVGRPANTFGGFGNGVASWDDPKLIERLRHIGGTYATQAATDMYCRKHNGKMRISGIGPALVSLAAMASGQNDARAIARSQGLFADDWDEEKFENRYGFTSVAKAKTRGVKGLNNEVRKVALAEGSGITGGYVIPPQFMNELLTIAGEDAFVEPRAKVIPMNSRTATWPLLDITTVQAVGTTPYYGGILASWQPEAATINETEPTFRQSEWVAWDLVLYTVSSNQLLADNGIGLDALLTQLFGQALTWYKEYAFLRGLGAGASMPLGILNAPATITTGAGGGGARVLAGHFTLSDAAAMMSHLQIRSWDDACWVMHQSVLPELIQMVGGNSTVGLGGGGTALTGNVLSWMAQYGDGKVGPAAMKLPNAFLNGLPIFFTEKLPQLGTKGDVMLCDFSRYVIGMRLDMQIDVSPHYLFRNNQLAWRVIARCDGKPWLNSFITDQSGWTVSPFIALNGT